jgi:erythronate-4-phosphate dehydrogenase
LLIVADRNIPHVQEAFRRLGEVVLVETGAMVPRVVHDADALIVRSETPVGAALLEGSKVRFVGTATIGTDHIDTRYLDANGIAFASAPGSNANSVAEYVTAALLALAERRGGGLAGLTLGVVGVGHVGSKVVNAAGALGIHVLLCDPPLGRTTGESRFRPLDDLMDADIITLHVPLTTEGADPTYHLFDIRRLKRMKEGAVLINTARGAVVDSAALKEVLAAGTLSAAILDVWENEPAIDTGLMRRTLLATPHIAGYSLDGKVNAVRMMCGALYGFAGADPHSVPEFHLHPPSVDRVTLSAAEQGGESVLRTIVAHSYDILRDDRRLRSVEAVPDAQRGNYFRGLRKEYPVRREFPATTVILPPEKHSLAGPLRQLGFRVECVELHHA